MAETTRQQNTKNLKSFRFMDLAILGFSIIFIIDAVFYFILDGSLRDFVVMMFSLFMAIITLTTRLRYQPEIGRQLMIEWIAVSIIGIILTVYLTFLFTL